MDLILDGHGPLNAQLVRAIRTAVSTGRLAVGARLPATRALASDLGLSRTTVMNAYEQLCALGYLHGRVGAGSFITQPFQPRETAARVVRSVKAQSRYTARARACHDMRTLPYRRVPDTRFTFQSGVASVNPALPTLWGRELARAANYTVPDYPQPQGVEALREQICEYLARRRGVMTTPEDILVVTGSQQALALTCRVLLDEGDAVVIEEPQYFGARESLLANGAQLEAVRVDEDGLITARLPQRAPRLICVTPSHQFPTGAVLSQQRRHELLRYAHTNDCWIYEDDYDGEFRYGRRPLPALQALDPDGRVIYVGSFSKTLFPALRLGYVVLPSALREDFLRAKWLHDFGSATVEQVALANFMKSGSFDRHLRTATKALASRRQALTEALVQIDRGRLEFDRTNAGVHVALWLKDTTTDQLDRLIAHARQQGLGLHSLAPCFHGEPRAGLLLSYGTLSVEEIREAVAILGRCLDERSRWH